MKSLDLPALGFNR